MITHLLRSSYEQIILQRVYNQFSPLLLTSSDVSGVELEVTKIWFLDFNKPRYRIIIESQYV